MAKKKKSDMALSTSITVKCLYVDQNCIEIHTGNMSLEIQVYISSTQW